MADLVITKEILDKLLELGKIGQEEYKKLSRLQAIMMAEKKPTEFIYDELQAIKEKFSDIAENTKGIKEVDLKKIKGARGEKGEKGDRGEKGDIGATGKQGPAGKDGKTPKAGVDFPLPKNGLDGKDGKDGKSIVGDKGDKPDHKWEGTKLMFEKPNGKWGKAVDLKGKDGKNSSSIFGGGLFSVAHDDTLSGDGTLNNPLSVLSGGGASAFTDLTDVPSSYSGQGTKFVRVNGAETALEFATISGGGDALTSAPLSQFAATTSSQLKGVISDETGSGALVFADTPTLVTPVLGAATGTSLQLSGLTASELLSTDASKNLTSLPVASYPSLAEIAYVKGVTSAIQTQLNAKQATLVSGTNIKTINGTSLLGSGDITISGTIDGSGTTNELAYWTDADTLGTLAVATYPSLAELAYVKGVTSAIQTQLNNKQPLDSDLTTIASLTATSDNFLQAKSSAWASRTPTQVTADLIAFVGDSGSGGTKGLVPAPTTGDATKYLKGDGTWATVSGGGDALTTNPLSQFAATTSSQLAGVISDETGSGALVFADTPTLVTPVLGVATATSINKVAITAPATSATLTIADGKTLTASNTITFTATDGSTLAIGAGGTLGSAAYTASSAYEVPLTFSTGLTRSTNTITVNTTQNIAKLSNLTSNGFVKTSGGDGTLSIDTNTYLTSLTGAVLTDQTVGQTIGATGARLTKLWATDIESTNAPTVSGAAVYYTGGTDVALADGGTGASLSDPNADRIMFWDDSAGAVTWLTAGTGLTITGTTITASGSGTVTNTGGNLTANAVVLGAGTVDTKVVAGITTDGTSVLNLGVNATTIGKVKMFGNTSGDVTIQPSAVAGTATVLTLPATTDTLVGKATTDTLTNKTLTSPVLNGTASGTALSSTATASTLAFRNSSANLLANNFTSAYTSTATTGGTTTLVVGDAGMMAFTGTSTQDINLPVTSTLTVGHKYKIVNKSTISVRVLSSGGNTMAMVGPQQTRVFTCISTSGTSGTSWHFDAGFRWYELANGTNANQITVGNYGSGIAGALGNVGTSGRDFLISAPATSGSLILNTNATDRVTILSTGQTGFGQSTPTATIHLKAGTTAASSSPLKFTSGSLMTTAEAGAVEFLTDAFYGTITTGAARKTFAFLESPAFTTPNLGTPSAGTLTNCTGLPVSGITASTSTALGVGSIELGHASDTTISRSAAGVIAVEGVVIPSISSTNTLTNKRITKRTGTTTSSATPTINTDNVDFYSLTAQTVDITSFTTNLSGTPTEGQTLWIAITGTAARAITWGSSFSSSGTVTLPTTTVSTTRLDVGFIWNSVSSKWMCIAVA